jgi:hypothetical protein
VAEVGALPDSELRDDTCGIRDVLYAEAEAAVLGVSSVGLSLSLAIVECEFVREPRSEGLRRSNGAQAGVPVPLKSDSRTRVVFMTTCRLGPLKKRYENYRFRMSASVRRA